MALWQYELKVIPESSVVGRFGFVPGKLEINHEGWEDHSRKSLEGIDEPPGFEDAHTINWWEDVFFDRGKITSSIDRLIPKAGWGGPENLCWKGDASRDQDHDVYINFDERGNVADFTFRADLRSDSLDFLAAMLEICRENNWLVMDAKGFLMRPRPPEVCPSARGSDAAKFLEDPEAFFENLKDGS